MKCRLCGQDRKLIEAHIIPKSFFRIDPTDRKPVRMVTNVGGQFAQQLPKGAYDNEILCETCERRFARWDDYGNEIFIEEWAKFDTIKDKGEEHGYVLSEYNYALLKLFVISVLWRIAVSDHRMFRSVNLGPREEVLRKAIWDSNPGDADFFGVVLQAFNSTEVGILNPHSERFGHLRFVRIYLSHIIAFIKVDARQFDDLFRTMALQPNAPLVLANKDFASSAERRIMTKLVRADKKLGQA